MFKRLAMKYWPMALLLILIVAVLCMSRYAENSKAENAQANASKSTQRAIESLRPSWIETFAWPEGATAWALFLTLLVIAWQSTETREAAKSADAQIQMMKDKERARIAVDFPPSDLKLDDGPEWTQAMNVVFAGTEIKVINFGGTSAFNVTALGQIGRKDSRALEPLDITTVLKSNTDAITTDVIALLRGKNHVADVKNRTEILYLVGTIKYDDIFGEASRNPFSISLGARRYERGGKVFRYVQVGERNGRQSGNIAKVAYVFFHKLNLFQRIPSSSSFIISAVR